MVSFNSDTNKKILLSVDRFDGKVSEIQVNTSHDKTVWRVAGNKSEPFESVEVIDFNNIAVKTDTEEISQALSQVYAVIGVALCQDRESNTKILYYLIIATSTDSNSRVLLIEHKSAHTKSLYKKMDITECFANPGDKSSDWPYPHTFINFVCMGPDHILFALYAIVGPCFLMGSKHFKNKTLIISTFNSLNDQNAPHLLQSRQQQQRAARSNIVQAVRTQFQTPGPGLSITLSEEIAAQLHKNEGTSSSKEKTGRYGISSLDSGGRNVIVPILTELSSNNKPVITQSEWHIVGSMPGVFGGEHNFHTLSNAIRALREKCPVEQYEGIAEAVAGKFLEDIGWRMSGIEPLPNQKFNPLKVDIDQATLHVKEFRLLQFSSGLDMSQFLDTMYSNIRTSVLKFKHVLHHTVSISYMNFKTHAQNGGHTYMTSAEKRNYIVIPTTGANGDVFRVSVKLHSQNQSLDDKMAIVWNAVLYIIDYLEKCSDRTTFQGTICADVNLRNCKDYTHKMVAGPMHALLTLCYLASVVEEGISFAIETYGGKTRAYAEYIPNLENAVTDDDADIIASELLNELDSSMSFVISRFSQFVADASIDIGHKALRPENNVFMWGIGCSVSTVHIIDSELQPPSSVMWHNQGNTSTVGDSHTWPANTTTSYSIRVSEPESVPTKRAMESDAYRVAEENYIDSCVTESGVKRRCIESSITPSQDSAAGVVTDVCCDEQSFLVMNNSHVLSTNNLERLSSLTRLNKATAKPRPQWASSSTDSQIANVFTVVNLELPPFAKLVDQPKKWFEGQPFSECSNSPVVGDEIAPNSLSDDNADTHSDHSEYEADVVANDTFSQPNVPDGTVYKSFINRNVAIKCKTHITYPIWGGMLPFAMQPTTYECAKLNTNSHFNGLTDVRRVMCYNINSRLAAGEYNVPLPCSSEVSRIYFDISGTKFPTRSGRTDTDDHHTFGCSDNAIFNMKSCMARHEKFHTMFQHTINNVAQKGSSSRIEIAFQCRGPEDHYSCLQRGVKQIIEACMNNTKSYPIEPIVEVVRFFTAGILGKLKFLEKMLRRRIESPGIYDELVAIRTEVAALLRSYHSGKGRLKMRHVLAPKLAYMACRPILNRLLKFTDSERDLILSGNPDLNYYSCFVNSLIDLKGNPHVEILVPYFYWKYEEKFTQKYVSAYACDLCYKAFITPGVISAFDSHSCLSHVKGGSMKLTDDRFTRHYKRLFALLNDQQRLVLEKIHEDKHNILVTGFAGSGKSLATTVAILQHVIKFGMYTFAVLAPTKVAAGLIGGITYHSFLSLGINRNEFGEQIEEILPKKEIIKRAREDAQRMITNNSEKCVSIRYGLKVIFLDECGMLSHDQLLYMDYLLRTICSSRNPYGGIRVVLIGDFLQLPPLVKQPPKVTGKSTILRKVYCFESSSFLKGNYIVIYLKQNHRQGEGESTRKFVDLLNRMRDGIFEQQHCDTVNQQWGNNVTHESCVRVLNALYIEFDNEIQKLKQEKEEIASENKSYTGSATWTKFDNLMLKMRKHWNPLLLLHYFEYMYDPDTFAKRGDRDYRQSDIYKGIIAHIGRLIATQTEQTTGTLPQKTKAVDLLPVITMENAEIATVQKHYNIARGNVTVDINSTDQCDNEDVDWTDKALLTYVLKESKLEQCLTLSINQMVSFTSNDCDPNASNNSLGIVVDFKYVNAEIDTIVVEPILQNADLKPHPIHVKRKSRVLKYERYKSGPVQVSRSQFPLRASDAFTPNSVQGISMLISYIINLQRCGMTGYGRVYVAASRAHCEAQVFFLFPLCICDVAACPIALAFDKHLRNIASYTFVDFFLVITNDRLRCEIVTA